jgi:hypothetical protein
MEDCWLVPGSSHSHLTVQIRVRGHRARVWRLKAELFNSDSGDVHHLNEVIQTFPKRVDSASWSKTSPKVETNENCLLYSPSS